MRVLVDPEENCAILGSGSGTPGATQPQRGTSQAEEEKGRTSSRSKVILFVDDPDKRAESRLGEERLPREKK